MKYKVYQEPPITGEDMQQCIIAACAAVSLQT
jgi:hypothetical protein